MRLKTATWISLAFLTVGCVERGEPKDGSQVSTTTEYLRIGTWNVRNLFDTVCDSGHCESGDYEPSVSAEAYKHKVESVVAGIKKINADVLMLQEIEKEDSIFDIQAELPEYKYYLFGETGRVASVDVAIISKFPITASKKYRDANPFTIDGAEYLIARELLHASVFTDSQTQLEILTAHFISHVSDDPGLRRTEEVRITSEILSNVADNHKDALVVFGGDLNDEPGSSTLNRLDEESSLINSRANSYKLNYYTCQRKYNLDHIYHNEPAKNALIDTEIICDSSSYGFSTSDHCAVVALYGIVHETTVEKE